MSPGTRGRAAVGIALAQLRYAKLRTVLAITGVTLAVVAATLLTGTGIGIVETGQEKFDTAGRDLWITGGPVQFAPGQVGGVQNSIRDSHGLAAQLRQRDDIFTVGTLLFQTAYVSPDGTDYRTLAVLGVPRSNGLEVSAGRGFDGDPHYADGAYDGPMTHEIMIDQRTASLFDVHVGDTLHVGGTISTAQQHQFVIVGISSTGSRFLGVPTISMPLSELQEITGKTGNDPATLVTVTVADDRSVTAVQQDLQRAYPQYTVRTNQEQLQATLRRQTVALAGGASLVVLAILAGFTLTLNALLSMLVQQIETYAALKSLGISTGTLAMTALIQTLVVGLLGGGLALALVLPATSGLNYAIETVVGFENVVRLSPRLFALGGGIALTMSLVSGLIAAFQLRRLDPLSVLQS